MVFDRGAGRLHGQGRKVFLDLLPLFLWDNGKKVRLGELDLFFANEGCIRVVRKRAGPIGLETAEEILLLHNKGAVSHLAVGCRLGEAPVVDEGPDKFFDFLYIREEINPLLDIIVPAVVEGLNGYLGQVAPGENNKQGLIVLSTDFPEKRNPVHLWHGIIRDNCIELVLTNQPERFGRGRAGKKRKIRLMLKIFFKHIQDIDVVVNIEK